MGIWPLERGMILALAAVAAALAWSAAATALDRRRRLRTGEIRELDDLWLTVEGVRTYARRSIEAEDPRRHPVVLVHGLGVSSTYFVPTAERLAKEFAVYAPDLPGHGRSATPTDPMDIPRLGEALIAWMNAAGLHRAQIVANSMGCQVAVHVAWNHPERVDRLVLTGPTADPAGRTTLRLLGRLLLCVPFERPSLVAVVLGDYARMGWRFFSEFRAMRRYPLEDRLAKVAAPTVLVRGEHDFIAPRRWVAEAARRVGAVGLVEIPWWGHAVNYSAARELVDAIAPFLRAARRPDASTGRGTGFERMGSPRN